MPNTNTTLNATTYQGGLDCLRMIEATDKPSIIDAMAEIAPDLARGLSSNFTSPVRSMSAAAPPRSSS